MDVAVIGTGYVGLVTGTCLAELGHNVCCMDRDQEKIELILKGEAPFYEPGLVEMISRNQQERLTFTNDMKQAVEFAEIIMIAVGTPTEKNGTPNIDEVIQASMEIAALMTENKIVVIKSTVPVGTCRLIEAKMQKRLKERAKKSEFVLEAIVVSNPEFLRQGSAVEDFLCPDRIVVGLPDVKDAAYEEEIDANVEIEVTETSEGAEVIAEEPDAGELEAAVIDIAESMKQLYEYHLNAGKPYIETNLETSEMIKYASNAFLATKISFVNELAIISEKCGADMQVVSQAMGLDSRIGDKFLQCGPGYGGSCFPKDTKALLHIGKKAGYEPSIVKATVEVNENQIKLLFKKIVRLLGKVNGRTVTVLGLSFKPETDDLRESPSIALINWLIKEKAIIKVYDPQAMEKFARTMEGKKTKATIEFCNNAIEACKDSECIILMTDWQEFKELDLDMAAQGAKEKILLDARNILDPEKAEEAGFLYEGTGGRSVSSIG